MALQHWPTCKDCGVSAPDVELLDKRTFRCGGCQEKLAKRKSK